MPGDRKWAAIAAFATLCVIWSSTWLVIKVGLEDLPPISYAAMRFLIAFVVLVAVFAGARAPAAEEPLGLDAARFHRRAHVRDELRAALLGRAAYLLRAGGGLAGDDCDLRTWSSRIFFSRLSRCAGNKSPARFVATSGVGFDLRTLVRSRRNDGLLGRTGRRDRRRGRRLSRTCS